MPSTSPKRPGATPPASSQYLHPYGIQGVKSDVREAFSRVKAITDTTLGTPALGGTKIPIGGDNGRISWGSPPPPGTPPAGSPGR